MLDSQLGDEPARLAALRRYRVLDTGHEEQFENVVQLIKSIFEVPIVAISLVDSDRQWFKASCGLGVRETPRNISFCTHAIKAREALTVEDAAESPLFRDSPLVTGDPFIRSYLGAPLKSPDGYNVGTVCVIDTRPRSYSREQIDILESFARLVVDELELRLIAAADSLTGARSRRSMLDVIEKELARGRRHGGSAVLVMVDIDNFKLVNDECGHEVGDFVLTSFAALCAEGMRESDTLGRMGGEEFAMMLPQTTMGQGLILIERLRKSLQRIRSTELGGRRITASFGLAELVPSDDAAKWLARADQAMYRAKRDGRDRVVLAEPPVEPAPAPSP